MIFLGFCVLYLVIGYGMYRITCIINPLKRGAFCGGEYGDYTTWNGSPLPSVLFTCLSLWPLVAAVETIRFSKLVINRFLQNQAKKAMIKKVQTIEPFLEEGVREVEDCLTEIAE